MNPIVSAFIRHALTVASGSLVTRGLIDASSAEILVGAVAAIIGVAWSVYDKRSRQLAP